MRASCLYCESALVRYAHWGVCPTCPEGRAFLAAITPPSLAEQIQAKVGGLILDKGRPTMNGARR